MASRPRHRLPRSEGHTAAHETLAPGLHADRTRPHSVADTGRLHRKASV
jgi:hypothetical protein